MTSPPHETPFHYDDALVSSCASSRLATSLSLRSQRDENGRGVVVDESFGTTPSSQKEVRQQRQHDRKREALGDCQSLFKQHAAHYLRPSPSEEEDHFWKAWAEEEDQFWKAWADGDGISNNNNIMTGDETTLGNNIIISPRIETFLRSVMFVQQHNSEKENIDNHRVALNRFSDMLPHELPLMSDTKNSDAFSFGDGGAAATATGGFEPLAQAAVLDGLPEYLNLFPNHHHHQGMESYSSREDRPVFVPLDDDDTIGHFGKKIRRMQQQQQQRESQSSSDNPASSSYISNIQSVRDSWWWIGGGHNHGDEHLQDSSLHRKNFKKTKDDDSFILDKEHELGGLEEKEANRNDDGSSDDWSHYLNWATEDNPDGVPVVHPPMDQGLCGSCWAITATGTLEASIARNMAYVAYKDVYSFDTSSHISSKGDSSPSSSKKGDDDPTMFAVSATQEIERRSIDTADLSVQQLVDCDQSCAGGIPHLAFYFLHRWGIASAKNYPYTGTKDSCKIDKIDQPIATVESWGILEPDYEDNMEKVLRYIGPVAVGLIGADPAFLGYEKGVFKSTKGGRCDYSNPDHAILITGYGEEVSKDGSVEKYWIARNSWGSGWGENGYVRMTRLGGKKGHRGVCGIAHSPSVALGGMFMRDVKLDKAGVYGSTFRGEEVHSDIGNGHTDKTTIIRASSQIQNVIHKIRLRLGFAQKGIMMSTMDGREMSAMDGRGNGSIVGTAITFAIAVGMLSMLLLSLAQLFLKRRRGRQQKMQRVPSSEEESIATSSWSTRAVYNGVHEDIDSGKTHGAKGSISCSDGERMHLLENSSGSLYTS